MLLRRFARSLVVKNEGLYLWLARMHRPGNAVTNTHHIVIEGYPRSGNTFAVRAMQMANDNSLRIASHLHVPAQLKRGIAWGLPCVLLIRNPVDAIASNKLFSPHVSLQQLTLEYLEFYRQLLPHKKHLIVGQFEDVTADINKTIELINAKYSTRFGSFDNSEKNRNLCFEKIEAHMKSRGIFAENKVGRPSSSRTESKTNVCEELRGPRYSDLLSQCEKLYEAFIHVSDTAAISKN